MSDRRRDDRRSAEAQRYRHLYKGPQWEALRQATFVRDGRLCQLCYRRGRLTPATVVHHREPHKGDPVKFYDPDNVEACCSPCHDGPVQSEERIGYSTEIGTDGWPVDARHPANIHKT
jgi:5-methylcytosine-specific restriction endonuclease McrA